MKTLFIFDFDDTLALTNSHVIVNDSTRLTTRQFAKYRAQPSDKLDFSEFEDVTGGSLIKSSIDAMDQAINQYGFNNVYIVTARASAPPVKKFLESQGVEVPEIVATAGSENKARWLIQTLYKKDYDRVVVYEDCNKNIKMLKDVVETFNIENQKNIQYSSVCVLVLGESKMRKKEKILRRLVRELLIETAAGRRAARASLHRKNRINASGSEMVEYEDWLQDKYGPYLDELDVGWSDGEGRDPKGWMVLDEIEGRWIHSGVTQKGPIGQMKAWDYVNGADVKKQKASQKASQYYYG